MGCAQKLIPAKLREVDKNNNNKKTNKQTKKISKKIALSFHNKIREKSLYHLLYDNYACYIVFLLLILFLYNSKNAPPAGAAHKRAITATFAQTLDDNFLTNAINLHG